MNYMLDTNACVAILRNRPPSVRERAEAARAGGSGLSISSIALHELWYGTYKSTRVDQGVWQLRMFLAGEMGVLDFDETDARIAGRIRAELASTGTMIAEYDMLIGGQCLRHGLTLVTNNISEFARIRGLAWEDWTQ
jgi:tRNA(fMet)-specific endonuclease VapC